MDVKQYYRKMREIESGITNDYVYVTSLETADGGKPGIMCEVSREQAAKLIVEGRVTLSTNDAIDAFIVKRDAQKKAFEKAEAARRLQVTIVSATERDDPKQASPVTPEASVRK